MTKEEFDVLLDENIESIKNIMRIKGNEYSRDDRLSNFKKSALDMRCTPEKALLGFFTKHKTSIYDMVFDLDKNVIPDPDLWKEKIIDAVNYLLLLDGLMTDRRQSRGSQKHQCKAV